VVEVPALTLAFAAGFVSFISPCCLPLVPGYLAAIGAADPVGGQRIARRRILARSGLFVATFSLIFILLGLTATAIGALLFDSARVLNTVAGIVMVAMGLLFVAAVPIARLNRDFRPRRLIEGAGTGGPVVAGAAFAIAWTPCVGPTLGAILGLAATQSGVAQGGLLLATYSAGLAIPFVLVAVGFHAGASRLAWLRRRHAAVQVVSGLLLAGMGTLVLSGQLFRLNTEAQRFLDRIGLDLLLGI
jgi:cytochrome c-type biogenesis protein